MAMTLKEALSKGHEVSLTDEEIKATHGDPIAVNPDCSSMDENQVCAEYKCVEGWKIIKYCDAAGGCTRQVRVPC